jgi:hypothetical protein
MNIENEKQPLYRWIIDKEKKKLIELIEPAIKHFIEATGTTPEISITQKEVTTACGTIKEGIAVVINAYV